MVEKAKDIVERLRKEAKGFTVNLNPWPTMRSLSTMSFGFSTIDRLAPVRLVDLLLP